MEANINSDIIVVLNGKWCRGALNANEQEGWVEVLDIASMAPLDANEGQPGNNSDEKVAIVSTKTKKIYGNVEIKKIVLKQK